MKMHRWVFLVVGVVGVLSTGTTSAALTGPEIMKKNEEYVQNRGRDWLIFLVSTVAMLAFLWFKPEWVWVVWPFQLTALAGALGRI